jgi:hypothetical protein
LINNATTGDGSIAVVEAAKKSAGELKERAAKINVAIEQLVFYGGDFGPHVLFSDGTKTVNSAEGVFVELGSMIDKHAPRATR